MDDLARFNQQRWNALVEAGIEYSRPLLDLDEDKARHFLRDPGLLGDVRGKNVLCLANGGGQQSAAFSVLGAQVTVLDLSDAQLEMDRQAATHYGVTMRIEPGDMRDLSRFEEQAFDIVWQEYSINFVPNCREVFTQVRRVIRPKGLYRVDFANPDSISLVESTWNGRGYVVSDSYIDGEVQYADPAWDVQDASGSIQRVEGPREFRHTFSTFLNGLADQGFMLTHFEEKEGEGDGKPGSWEHMITVIPPWFRLWTILT
jgi:ubiquinone/menaquinone biosynthesis C-methylase UbiE